MREVQNPWLLTSGMEPEAVRSELGCQSLSGLEQIACPHSRSNPIKSKHLKS